MNSIRPLTLVPVLLLVTSGLAEVCRVPTGNVRVPPAGIRVNRASFSVESAMEDTGSEIKVELRIVNCGASDLSIDPSTFVLDVLGPKHKTLPAQDPEKVARHAEDRARMEINLANNSHMTSFGGKNDKPVEDVHLKAEEVLKTALTTANIAPGQALVGYVYFPRERKKSETVLRVNIGQEPIEVNFLWDKERAFPNDTQSVASK